MKIFIKNVLGLLQDLMRKCENLAVKALRVKPISSNPPRQPRKVASKPKTTVKKPAVVAKKTAKKAIKK